MAKTAFVSHRACLEHRTGPSHPERPERLAAVLERVEPSGLAAELSFCEAQPIERERVVRVHAEALYDEVRQRVESGGGALDGDTWVSPGSLEAARLAAGGAVQAAQGVLSGEWKNAFVAVRPPGHHAERDRAMGFCLFNNAAVAAEALRVEYGLERVAIVDWDVHHGNGTQHLFEEDAGVFYASLHQWPLYPGTGAARERGRGAGEGATLNLPQPAGAGDAQWLEAFEAQLLPALEDFDPQFVIVSAGFDGHAQDPLAATRLSETAFREMSRGLLQLAEARCCGRLISLLEGGYDLDALARSVEAHLEELQGA